VEKKNHVAGKSVIVTGAGSGFGKLLTERAAARGALLTCGDINQMAMEATVEAVRGAGGRAQALRADVSRIEDMHSLARAAVNAYGRIDVMVNNAGIMPLAFVGDHQRALEAWNRCIDINVKGVINGTLAVYDQMMAQGQGQVINLSSIFGNHPVAGGAVYGATKAAINYFSESLRIEARGKIKVTVVKPTGVGTTGLSATVVNPQAGLGVYGQNAPDVMAARGQMAKGTHSKSWLEPESVEYMILGPEYVADAILYAIDQPWGVSIGDITVRAAGDYYIV
jgi:NADP-dependent 3-hydroxy acid dehydrogenase YdfG